MISLYKRLNRSLSVYNTWMWETYRQTDRQTDTCRWLVPRLRMVSSDKNSYYIFYRHAFVWPDPVIHTVSLLCWSKCYIFSQGKSSRTVKHISAVFFYLWNYPTQKEQVRQSFSISVQLIYSYCQSVRGLDHTSAWASITSQCGTWRACFNVLLACKAKALLVVFRCIRMSLILSLRRISL